MIALRAARVLADGVAQRNWWVTIGADGLILDAGAHAPRGAERMDLGEVDLVPGFIDLHSDCLENLAHPRPTAPIALEAALHDLDALAVAHGVTTNFVCLGLEDDATKHRHDERAVETEELLRRLSPVLRADYALHLRVDVTADHGALMRRLAQGGFVKLVSYMDHTPGQGQYASEDEWRAFYKKRDASGDDELNARLDAKRAGQAIAREMREAVANFAHGLGVALASHDDDSTQAVEEAVRLGVHISEFPVSEEAASAAKSRGLGTIMGAPNARRGRSHLTNLSARDAMALGLLDALASDYHPPSLLVAAYAMSAAGVCSWEAAMEVLSAGPARIARLSDRGVIAPGARADLTAISERNAHPIVVQTWVLGKPKLGALPKVEALEGVAS